MYSVGLYIHDTCIIKHFPIHHCVPLVLVKKIVIGQYLGLAQQHESFAVVDLRVYMIITCENWIG